MSRTLETKSKILGLLKDKDMTITGLSAALGLSTATVSQHMEELSRSGAIERVENEHYRKLKYYRIRGAENVAFNRYAKYFIALAILSAVSLEFYFYGLTTTAPVSSSIPVLGIQVGNPNSTVATGRYANAINKTPVALLPANLSETLNTSRADGFNFSQGMFRSNSSSQCVRVRISSCDNNAPSQFACLNASYYRAYLGQQQAAFSGQERICPQYLLRGTISCASVGGYCEVASNQSAP